MSLVTISNNDGYQNGNFRQVKAAVTELQGFSIDMPAGAAAATKMNVPAIRSEDTLKSVIQLTSGVPVDDTANCTIVDTRASGTVTFATAIEGSAFSVNGTTYTVRAVPLAVTDILLGGTDAQMATKAAAAVNAFENRAFDTNGNPRSPSVIASSTGASGVVTFISLVDGAGNAPAVTNSAHATVTNNNTALVTATCASVVATDTLTVNGVVFTVTATPLLITDVLLGGSDNAQALNFANALNYYQGNHGFSPAVQAANVSAAVNISPLFAKTGNIIPLTGTVTVLAASGATLAGGTATGGIKSSTNNTGKNMLVFWFNKR